MDRTPPSWQPITPRPVVQSGQVLIKVAATSVNTVDTMIRTMGADLPISPPTPALLGMDVAGIVCEIGADVDGFAVGDAVFGCGGGLSDLPGSLAEFMAVDHRLIAHKPTSLSMSEAAALPLVGITAYEGLQRAGISSGQQVLVHGGSGGVGHIAVQLAAHFGAKVAATGGGARQLDLIKQLGATPINYRNEDVGTYVERLTAGTGFDLIFDSVGGANMLNSFAAAKLNGHVASTVSMCDIDLSIAHFKGLSLHVVFMLIPMLHNVGREQHAAILNQLANISDAGHLKPVLDSEYPLSDVQAAHARLQSRQAMGKVVVTL